MAKPAPDGQNSWDRLAERLTAHALSVAASGDNAVEAADQLARRCQRAAPGLEIGLMLVRNRLVGRLEGQPDDLLALTAMGIAGLAALREAPETPAPAPRRPPEWGSVGPHSGMSPLALCKQGAAVGAPLDDHVDAALLARKKPNAST
jgi:hypothetical protein